MALWLDSRAYNNQPPLHQHCDFVFVTPDLHKDFDSFKEVETSPNNSFLPLVELLEYWNARRPIPSPTVVKYSKRYLNLRSSEVDELCEWVYDMRELGLNIVEDMMEGVNDSKFKYWFNFYKLPVHVYTCGCLISIEHTLPETFDNSCGDSGKRPVQKRDRSQSPEVQRKKRRPGDTKVGSTLCAYTCMYTHVCILCVCESLYCVYVHLMVVA